MSLGKLESILCKRLPDVNGPGVQVVLVSSRGIIYEGCRGLADPLGGNDDDNDGENDLKKTVVTTRHQANLYSVTKFFTACCILRLIEQGKLFPWTRARDVLPESMRDLLGGNDCTIEQLVLHTASMPNPLPLSWMHGVNEQVEEEDLLVKVLKTNVEKKRSSLTTGSPRYHYSNVGYWILGCIICRVCGDKPMSSFAQVCDDLLFKNHLPHNDRRTIGTTFHCTNNRMQVGYVSRWSVFGMAAQFLTPKWIMTKYNMKWIRMEPHYLNGASFGGMISSTHTVGTFLQCVLNDQILSANSTKLLFTPQSQPSNMTFGLHVRAHNGMPVYHKEGGGAGCHSSVHFRPYQDLAACVIAGDAQFDVNGLLDELLDCAAVINEERNNNMVESRSKYVDAMDGCALYTKCYLATRMTARTTTNASSSAAARDDSPILCKDPILLIHGGPGVPDYLEPLANLLLHSRIASSVITYDQRGIGKSRQHHHQTNTNMEQLSMSLLVRDIECIRNAYNAEKIHIVGHSWGGILAQLYACQYPTPVASLVLLSSSTAAQGSEWMDMEYQALKYNQRKGGWINFAKMGLYYLLMNIPLLNDYGARKLFTLVMKNYYYDTMTAPDPSSLFLNGVSARASMAYKRAFIRDVTTAIAPPTTKDKGGVSLKCLATFGDRDIYGDHLVKEFRERFSDDCVEIIENCGHLQWLDQPKVLTRLLVEFYRTMT